MNFISFILIPVLVIIIGVIASFKFNNRTLLIIILAIITIVLSCFKGCDDIKRQSHAERKELTDSLDIASLKRGQFKMIAERKVDSTNSRIFFDSLKSIFHIVRDTASNLPVFIGTNSPSIVQQNQKGKNEAYQNNGTNNGAIGPNAKVINEEKIEHPDLKLLRRIKDSAENKASIILIKWDSGAYLKNETFAKELMGKLQKAGYLNVKLFVGTYSGQSQKKEVQISRIEGGLFLFVNMY